MKKVKREMRSSAFHSSQKERNQSSFKFQIPFRDSLYCFFEQDYLRSKR